MGGFKRETSWLTGCGNPIQEGLGPPNLFGFGLATPVALVVLEYPAEGNLEELPKEVGVPLLGSSRPSPDLAEYRLN